MSKPTRRREYNLSVLATVSRKRGVNMLVYKFETYSSLKQLFWMTVWIDGIRRFLKSAASALWTHTTSRSYTLWNLVTYKNAPSVLCAVPSSRLSVSNRPSSQNLPTVWGARTIFWHLIEIVLTSTNTWHSWNWQVGIHVPMTIKNWSFKWHSPPPKKKAIGCKACSSVCSVMKVSFRTRWGAVGELIKRLRLP